MICNVCEIEKPEADFPLSPGRYSKVLNMRNFERCKACVTRERRARAKSARQNKQWSMESVAQELEARGFKDAAAYLRGESAPQQPSLDPKLAYLQEDATTSHVPVIVNGWD